jgi:hypothetical protein
LCREALRRVRQREARWQPRFSFPADEQRRNRHQSPPDWSG